MGAHVSFDHRSANKRLWSYQFLSALRQDEQGLAASKPVGGTKRPHAVIVAFEVDALFPQTGGVCLD